MLDFLFRCKVLIDLFSSSCIMEGGGDVKRKGSGSYWQGMGGRCLSRSQPRVQLAQGHLALTLAFISIGPRIILWLCVYGCRGCVCCFVFLKSWTSLSTFAACVFSCVGEIRQVEMLCFLTAAAWSLRTCPSWLTASRTSSRTWDTAGELRVVPLLSV